MKKLYLKGFIKIKYGELLIFLILLTFGNVLVRGENIMFKSAFEGKVNSDESKYNNTADVPEAPVLISPANNDTLGANDTALVWRPVSGASSYRVLIALDGVYFTIIMEDTTITRDTALSLRLLIGAKLNIGTKYFWRVSASNSSGASPYSETRSFVPVPLGQFIPGAYWYDTDKHLIDAHGGGLLYDDSSAKYYWYGEYRTASNTYHATGVSCYSSKNLYSWKFEGIVLSDTATSAGGTTPVLERPKVIYNDSTKKYVMWMHIDASDYSAAKAGVAVSDKPTGPFTYLGSERPNGQMSRDMSLFKDDNGKAYLIYSSENNATMDASLLTGDYLHQSGTYARILVNENREAPAMFKYNNKYYLITSGTSGWAPNAAKFAYSNSPLGPWILAGNPCFGTNADITFGGQGTFVLPVQGQPGRFIFMADKWISSDLPHSTYIWLPLDASSYQVTITWNSVWDLSLFDRATIVKKENNLIPEEFSMSQNYPNPFNPTTEIKVKLNNGGITNLTIYNYLGQALKVIDNGYRPAGEYTYKINLNKFASGVYIYVLRSGDNVIARKMIFLK